MSGRPPGTGPVLDRSPRGWRMLFVFALFVVVKGCVDSGAAG